MWLCAHSNPKTYGSNSSFTCSAQKNSWILASSLKLTETWREPISTSWPRNWVYKYGTNTVKAKRTRNKISSSFKTYLLIKSLKRKNLRRARSILTVRNHAQRSTSLFSTKLWVRCSAFHKTWWKLSAYLLISGSCSLNRSHRALFSGQVMQHNRELLAWPKREGRDL